MESRAYGASYRATIEACAPFTKLCPQNWTPYADLSLTSLPNRPSYSSYTVYGGLVVRVEASDVLSSALLKEREQRITYGIPAEELQEEVERGQAAELGLSFRGRSFYPVGKPPSRRQMAQVIPSAGKSMAELYHPEVHLPPTVSVAEQMGMAPVREAKPRPTVQHFITFRVPPTALQLFCRWIRAKFTDKSTQKDLVNWTAASLYQNTRTFIPSNMRVSSLFLEFTAPSITYFTILAVLRQAFGDEVLDRLTPTRFAQVMSENGWVDHRVVGSNLTIWTPSSPEVVPKFQAQPMMTSLAQF